MLSDLQDLLLDVLINKDRPVARDAPRPTMPAEILSSIPGTLQVDTVRITNGGLKYGERFAVGARPAVITFDSIQVVAKGITNRPDSGARGGHSRPGNVHERRDDEPPDAIPLALPVFSYDYSGSLSRMDLRGLNAFLETGEQMRIKLGVLQAAIVRYRRGVGARHRHHACGLS